MHTAVIVNITLIFLSNFNKRYVISAPGSSVTTGTGLLSGSVLSALGVKPVYSVPSSSTAQPLPTTRASTILLSGGSPTHSSATNTLGMAIPTQGSQTGSPLFQLQQQSSSKSSYDVTKTVSSNINLYFAPVNPATTPTSEPLLAPSQIGARALASLPYPPALPLYAEGDKSSDTPLWPGFVPKKVDPHPRTVLLYQEFKSHRVRTLYISPIDKWSSVLRTGVGNGELMVTSKSTKDGCTYEFRIEPHAPTSYEFSNLAAYVKSVLPAMSKSQIEELTFIIRHHYMLRFKKHKRAKYGNLNKGFTEQELQAFMRVIEKPKHKLLFSYQAQIGLRIGEAVLVNLRDLNLETRELIVRTEKARTLDTLLLPLPLFKATIEFAQQHAQEIAKSGGYLFFKDSKLSHRKEGYIEVNYARGRFSYYLQKAHLDEVYDVTEEAQGVTIRKLHRLTTHSLRHYAITRFAHSTNGNLILSSKFARHSNPNTTMTYIHNDKKEIYDVIDSISIGEIALLKKRLVK